MEEYLDNVVSKDKNEYMFHIPVCFHNLSRYDSKHIFKYFNPRVAAKYGKDEEDDDEQETPTKYSNNWSQHGTVYFV